MSPCLFSIFIYDAVHYIRKGNMHAPMTGETSITGFLFAYDLAAGQFTVDGLQKGSDQV